MKDIELRTPNRRRIIDDTLHILEDAILSGQFRPGERLVEATIAAKLGISRTTVREAFLMLEREGLVVSKPRRGTFVTRISREDALDLGYARALLEGFAVTVGHDRLDDDLIEALNQDIQKMASCQLPGDFPEIVRIDIGFHSNIMECAGLPRLYELWASLNVQLGALYIRAVEEYEMNVSDIMNFHQVLVDDLQRGDPEIALQAVIDHYVGVEGRISKHGSAIRKVVESILLNNRTSDDAVKALLE